MLEENISEEVRGSPEGKSLTLRWTFLPVAEVRFQI